MQQVLECFCFANKSLHDADMAVTNITCCRGACRGGREGIDPNQVQPFVKMKRDDNRRER